MDSFLSRLKALWEARHLSPMSDHIEKAKALEAGATKTWGRLPPITKKEEVKYVPPAEGHKGEK